MDSVFVCEENVVMQIYSRILNGFGIVDRTGEAMGTQSTGGWMCCVDSKMPKKSLTLAP